MSCRAFMSAPRAGKAKSSPPSLWLGTGTRTATSASAARHYSLTSTIPNSIAVYGNPTSVHKNLLELMFLKYGIITAILSRLSPSPASILQEENRFE